LRVYIKKEIKLFAFGTIALVGSNLGQLVIPLFVGKFINLINKSEFDQIWGLCSTLLIVVAVSTLLSFTYTIGIICL
jgi:ABC-type multidrug transport system fused ATPase/permease subunit